MPIRLAQSSENLSSPALSSQLGGSRRQIDDDSQLAAAAIAALPDAELGELARLLGVRLTIPLSQLDAETVRRGVELAVVIRLHLIHRLQEAAA